MREAVGDEGADVCVVSWPGATADHEAVMFATLADWSLGDVYADTVRLYGDHLAALGIEHFVSAIAVVRPNDGTVWSAGLPLAGAPGSGGAVASYVYALDAAGSSDDELARTRLAPNPGVSVAATPCIGLHRRSQFVRSAARE